MVAAESILLFGVAKVEFLFELADLDLATAENLVVVLKLVLVLVSELALVDQVFGQLTRGAIEDLRTAKLVVAASKR